MVQAAQDRARHHPPTGSHAARTGTLQPQAAMRSIAVVVIDELGQHRPQVALVDHDQVVETFGPNCPHDPLGHRIGVRRPKRGPDAGDSQTRQLTIKVAAVNGIPVMDQVPRLPSPGRRLQELVPDPSRGRTRGDVK